MTVLLACAVASWVLLSRAGPDRPPDATTPRLGVGYYATGATLSGSGTDGRFLYRVSAATVEQSPADRSIDLRDVAVDYAPPERTPWTLRSAAGRIPEGDRLVTLSGDVVASTQPADRPPTIIRTAQLQFDARTDLATTDGAVTIDYGGSAVRAIGLRANLADESIELLSEVAGTYVR